MKFSKVKIISALTVLSFSVFSLNAESEDSFSITSSAETDSGEISVIEEYAGSVSETELLTDEGIELSEAESVPAETVGNGAVLSATEAVGSVADENMGEVLPATETAAENAEAALSAPETALSAPAGVEDTETALSEPETALSAPAGADNSDQLTESAETAANGVPADESATEVLPAPAGVEDTETALSAPASADSSNQLTESAETAANGVPADESATEVLPASEAADTLADENMGEVLPATETAAENAEAALSAPETVLSAPAGVEDTETALSEPVSADNSDQLTETVEAVSEEEAATASDAADTAAAAEDNGDEVLSDTAEAEIPEEPVFSALLDPYSEIYEPYSETTEQEGEEEGTSEEPELPPEPPVPNSVMTFFSNEDFSITLTGRGWVFLGDNNNSKSVDFSGRQVSSTKTTFDFFAKNAGTALLKFWRQDSAKKKDVFNYIEVKVLEDPNFYDDWSTDTYFSGFYEEPDVIMFSDDFGFFGDYEDMDYEYEAELADKLRTAFEEEKYEAAISFADEYLESFFEYDEILFIKARSLEEKTKSRNIRTAYNLYRKIIEEYPESDFWQEANNRAVYLERFYFSIR
ncbi:MAG: hypothetical protein MJ183_08500 [Treponemataceae bacterium]|nr:hypothetical protein [Treponemataceae bacterium]